MKESFVLGRPNWSFSLKKTDELDCLKRGLKDEINGAYNLSSLTTVNPSLRLDNQNPRSLNGVGHFV